MENLYTQNYDSVHSSILHLGITSAVLFLLPIIVAAVWKNIAARRSLSLRFSWERPDFSYLRGY